MSFFSALKRVAKVATLPVTAPIRFQAKLGSRALSMVARAVPTPFSSGARPAAPTNSWRGSPVSPVAPPTPQQSSWFPSIAAAVNNVGTASAPTVLPPVPVSPYATLAPAPAPYGAPAPYAAPASYEPPPSYAPSSGGGWGGGGGGGGGGWGGGGSYDDGSNYSPEPDPGDSYGYGGGGESSEDEQLGDIDYEAVLGDVGGLGDWKSSLLSVAKGAASGALSTGAAALTQPSAAALAAARAQQQSAGMSTGTKLAIGAAVALPVAFLLLHRPARVATNPRRRRRRSRR
jgi:hypothetical protein